MNYEVHSASYPRSRNYEVSSSSHSQIKNYEVLSSSYPWIKNNEFRSSSYPQIKNDEVCSSSKGILEVRTMKSSFPVILELWSASIQQSPGPWNYVERCLIWSCITTRSHIQERRTRFCKECTSLLQDSEITHNLICRQGEMSIW